MYFKKSHNKTKKAEKKMLKKKIKLVFAIKITDKILQSK